MRSGISLSFVVSILIFASQLISAKNCLEGNGSKNKEIVDTASDSLSVPRHFLYVKTNTAGKLYLNGIKLTSSTTSGTWDSYNVRFQCNVQLDNVECEKSIAFDNIDCTSVLNNVSIVDSHNYYGVWIVAGCDVTMDGCSVSAPNGRCIKISDEYITTPTLSTLSVSNTTFESLFKAAIIVGSKAGATITLSDIDISHVASDNVNAVWVDVDWAAYGDLVTVTGGTKITEPEGM